MKFEAFGSSPEFTTVISKFMNENCNQLEEAKEGGEQPISNYLLFQKYVDNGEKWAYGHLGLCYNMDGFGTKKILEKQSFGLKKIRQ